MSVDKAHRSSAREGNDVVRGGVTARAILIGAVLSIALNFIAVRNYIVYNAYSGFADHFNTIGVVWLLFALSLLNVVLCPPVKKLRMRPEELVTVYAMLMVATAYPTMGFGGYLIPLIGGVLYYAKPENRWDELLIPNLPKHLIPQDRFAVRWLFEGGVSSPPISVWITPLAWWSAFAIAWFILSANIVAIFRRQWVEREKLVYPLAQVPAHLTFLTEEGRSGSFYRNKLMWIGFAISLWLSTHNYLAQRVPVVPPLKLANIVQVQRLGISFNFGIDTLVIGLTYLVNLDVAFSVWMLHLLTSFELGLLNFIGWGVSGPAQPHAAGGPLLSAQQFGAMLALILWSLKVALREANLRRRNLTHVGESDLNGHSTQAIPVGVFKPAPSCRAGNIAVGVSTLLSFLLIILFLALSGIPMWAIFPFLTVAMALFYGTTRLLVQTGIGRLRAPCAAAPLLIDLFGTSPFGVVGLVALGLTFVWSGDIQLFVMGTAAHALKLADDAGFSFGVTFAVMLLSCVLSILTTLWSYLSLGYRHGLINGYVWYFVSSPNYHWGWIADCIQNPRPPQWRRVGFMVGGAVFGSALMALHSRIVNFPLHPVGLCISQINTVFWDWFSMALAWATKLITLRYGGLSAYRASLPFFWGMILGSCVGRSIVALSARR
ncbi:MAG: hypothetical protein GDYSWBUE_000974 [Candidatus Fervidibacterota bacterium]